MSELNCLLAGILIAALAFVLGISLESDRIGALCDKKIWFMNGAKIYECQERRP